MDCTKDTYVSHALQTVRDPWWVEKQTGVSLATLEAHYAKWMPGGDHCELRRLPRLDPSLGDDESEMCPRSAAPGAEDGGLSGEKIQCEEGDLNPPNPMKTLRVFALKQARRGINRHEVDPQGPHLRTVNRVVGSHEAVSTGWSW